MVKPKANSRACLDCGSDITGTHHLRKRCVPCAEIHSKQPGGATSKRVGTPCVSCGTTIKFDKGNGTCSTRCYMWNRKHPGVPRKTEIRCGGCGEPLEIENQATKYCSSRCSAAASKRRNRDIKSDYVRRETCVTCGGPMPDGKKAGSKYCSPPCGASSTDVTPRQPVGERNCIRCGTPFMANDRRNVTCSRKCSKLRHYEQNKDLYTARAVAWQKAHPDRIREAEAAWRLANAGRIREQQRAYYRANPERFAVHLQKRRTAKLNNPGSVGISVRDWTRLVRHYQGRCSYCGTKPDVIHMEHVIPLSRGGRHAIGNVLPACPHCNLSKHDSLLAEWRYSMKAGDLAWLSPHRGRQERPDSRSGG